MISAWDLPVRKCKSEAHQIGSLIGVNSYKKETIFFALP
jgi:hypothetical protein